MKTYICLVSNKPCMVIERAANKYIKIYPSGVTVLISGNFTEYVDEVVGEIDNADFVHSCVEGYIQGKGHKDIEDYTIPF